MSNEVEKVIGQCPSWVDWIAQDADGSWWGYEVQPLQHDCGWYENEVGRRIKLHQGRTNPHWMHSLLRCSSV